MSKVFEPDIASTEICCPDKLDICKYMNAIPSYLRSKPKFSSLMCGILECRMEISAAIHQLCNLFDCDTATGEQLTFIGENNGWPRTHCNAFFTGNIFGYDCGPVAQTANLTCAEVTVVGYCEDAYYYCGILNQEDYVFEDDELYRSFVKARICANKNKRNKDYTVRAVRECIKALWGDNAFIVYADNFSIGVSAGRDLTPDEIAISNLYQEVICLSAGVRLDVFCIEPTGPLCPTETIDLDCQGGDTGTMDIGPFESPTGADVELSYSGPSWTTFTDNGDGTATIDYSVPLSGSNQMGVITATDCLGECLVTINFICDEQGNPIAPPDLTIDCKDFDAPNAPADLTINCEGEIL